MFMDPLHRMADDDVRGFVASVGSAQLVTVGSDGRPWATQLAILWDGDSVLTHIARDNPHFHQLSDGQPCLLIVQGPDAYIAPRWHGDGVAGGKVLPTWNYSTVQIQGSVTVREDPEWLRALLARTIDHHESGKREPWSLDDADRDHVTRLLSLAVGLEIAVEAVSAKAKLSQDKAQGARRGIIARLAAQGQQEALVARAMQAELDRAEGAQRD